ncbi:MAG: hypothetical protein IKW30_08400 [Lachnospiraceae bacterium]|nr:hypothetical protein [Lachnospiraceae bacterium]
MSVVFTATSLAIALAVSGVPAIMAMGLCLKKEEEIEALETCFVDSAILNQTLQEHGFKVEEKDGEFIVITNAGSIRFFRKEENGAFYALPFDLKEPDELGNYADEIEEEYLLNVQKSNYQLLKEQLKNRQDMQLESEAIMEDDSILLTIQL